MKNITSKNNERIKYVVKLSLNKKFRENEKKFVVEGFKAIYDAYSFGLPLYDIFIHPSILKRFEFIDKTKIVIVEDNILKKISTTDSFSKCVAVFGIVNYNINDLKTRRDRRMRHLYRRAYRLKKAFPAINTKEFTEILNKKIEFKHKKGKS